MDNEQTFIFENDESLAHVGTPHEGSVPHSGRYPYGSGEKPGQHQAWDYNTFRRLQAEGSTMAEIAEYFGLSQNQIKAKRAISKSEQMKADVEKVRSLKRRGYSSQKIEEMTGIKESTQRNYLKEDYEYKKTAVERNAELIKNDLKAAGGYIDVGKGTQVNIGINETAKDTAIRYLTEQGYKLHSFRIPQNGSTVKKFEMMVLAEPNITRAELKEKLPEIRPLGDKQIIDIDGTHILGETKPLRSIDPKRVQIVYAEQNGAARDGLIEIRRGVPELNLQKANYAQVRIAVNGTHYLKGMAVYADDLPPGIDIRFNTNKHEGTPMLGDKDNTVLKPLKKDPVNPFGATIKEDEKLLMTQKYYTDENGKKQLSALNIVNEEGDWSKWARNLSSQFLSKQNVPLAKRQLTLDYEDRKAEFDEIMSLTNNAVKQVLLTKFADNCDNAAVHMKAAALPRQQQHVILPFPEIKDNECYAPNYPDGTKVVLIRHPHAGPFEIPQLTVNNKYKNAIATIGKNAADAIGINSTVAAQLSGADYDGDSVLVIPVNDRVKVKTAKVFKELKDFDTKEWYHRQPGDKAETGVTDSFNKQIEMGKISNLITDMYLTSNPDPHDIALAARHSMVIIDAEKHNLDWKKSERDNHIKELNIKYRGGANKGASTLISKATSQAYTDERESVLRIDPVTGEKIWKLTGKELTKGSVKIPTTVKRVDPKTGEIVEKNVVQTREKTLYTDYNTGQYYYYNKRTKIFPDPSSITNIRQVKAQTETTKMDLAKDARELSSGTAMEEVYATYANSLKALANRARLMSLPENTPNIKVNSEAKAKYASEVASLGEKIKLAEANRPRERRATIVANQLVRLKLHDEPNMDDEHLKKARTQAMQWARKRVGAKSVTIEITDREWEAIQSGAVAHTTVKTILEKADLDAVKKRAMPKTSKSLSEGDIARLKARAKSGNYTNAELATLFGISASTVSRLVNAKD